MPHLIWSPRAVRDLSRLRRFLADKSPAASRRAIAALREGVKLLGDHPAAGRPVEAMPPEYREWPIGFGAGGYVALYRFDETEVVILAVRHGREAGF